MRVEELLSELFIWPSSLQSNHNLRVDESFSDTQGAAAVLHIASEFRPQNRHPIPKPISDSIVENGFLVKGRIEYAKLAKCKGFLVSKWARLLRRSRRSRDRLENSIRSRCVLKVASSEEQSAILKVMFQQANEKRLSTEGTHVVRIGSGNFVEDAIHEESLHDRASGLSMENRFDQRNVHEDSGMIDEARGHLEGTTSFRELQIYVVTWNMNGKLPMATLARLIQHGSGGYDFYVVGLQEAPKSSMKRFLLPILGRHYSLMAKTVMKSLQLYVFGKVSLQPLVSEKKVDKVKFKGFGGVVGRQKGAVAASLRLGESSFLFIASHFAAHESKLKERNVQYLHARQKMFSRPKSCLAAPVENDTDYEEPEDGGNNLVDESDVVIWLGDLNYRIEGSRRLVKSFVKYNLEKLLWKRDQLSNAVDKGQVFNGFVEGPLAFKPTYKYDVGTDNYDTSEKERVPSWTDRILIKVKDESYIRVNVVEYDSIDTLRTSDHRPVKALLNFSKHAAPNLHPQHHRLLLKE